MKQRSPIAVFLLPMVTFGIYSWYWAVKTKGEMNKLGEKIPTAWIWLIPVIGGIWWHWKYSEGVEHVTHEKTSEILAFVVLFLLGNLGQAIIQHSFNKIEATSAVFVAAPSAPFDNPAPVEAPMPSLTPYSSTPEETIADSQSNTPTPLN